VSLTVEELRTLFAFAGLDLETAELERLAPLVESHLDLMRQLHALDLGDEDPRTMHYVVDRRLLR
jgi:Asp-tRNA(Asn)/Glu-tRNA(Gln) amidotransferase C subunit